MAKRFPVLYPMPFGEDQYRKYLELAREPIDINEYIQKAWAEILPENPRVCRKHKELGFLKPQINCNDCIRYNKNMIEKTFDNIVRCGFLKKNKGYICPEHRKNKKGKILKPIDDCLNCKPYRGKICEFHKWMGVEEPDSDCIYCKEGHVSIELYPDGQKWLDGKLRGGFPKLVLESLKRGWGYQLRLPKAIDATLDILSEFSSLEFSDSISSIEIYNHLAFYQNNDENKDNHIPTYRKKGGYDFNYASGGSQRTLREILKLLVEMKALEKVGQGRYSKGKKIDSIIGSLKKADMLYEVENIIKNYGHKEQILETKEKDIELKSLLAKYYIYVQSGGIKKDQWFLRRIHKLLFKLPKSLPIEFSTGRKRKIDRKIGTEKKSLREIAAEKWGIEQEKLHGLYYSDLKRINDATSEDEVYFLLDSFSTKFNKTILDRLCHDNGTFNFPKNFNLYKWQNEAVNQWINGDEKDKHEKCKGIVSVVTGAGKTVMALKAIKEYFKEFPNAKVSVIVPTRVLMYQWAHEISKLLAISSSQIGFRGDGFKDSFNDKENERKIMILIVNSAIQDNFLRDDISQVDDQINHLLIADECHRYTGEKFQRIFDCRYNATLGLSATPIEEENIPETGIDTANDTNSATLFNKLGPIFYKLNYKEALNEEIISQFTVHYIGVELTKDERIEYDVETKKLAKVLEKIRVRYGNRLDLMPGSNLDQKLQTIIKNDDNPDSAIGQYFRLVRERRDTVYGAVNRKGVYYDILQKAIQNENKTIVFHEKINQLNEIVAPMELREKEVHNGRTKKNIIISQYEKAVNKQLEQSLYNKSYRPVMYHSLHEKDYWNRWAMDWFRDDIANTMLSVKALIEGVDVPSADVGIVRISSSSVRQRIQATGRILRKVKDGNKKSSNMYIIYVRDTVDENIFKKYDWRKELGETSDIKFFYWKPIKDDLDDPSWSKANFEKFGQFEEKNLDDLPKKKEYEDNRPPLEVDVSNLNVGDAYPGRFAGDLYHVTADGRPYKRSQFGRIFINTKELIKAGQLIREIKGGGKLVVTPQGNMVTMVKGQGPIFLGVTNPDLIRVEVKQKIESITKVKNGKMKLERPPTFEELFGNRV